MIVCPNEQVLAWAVEDPLRGGHPQEHNGGYGLLYILTGSQAQR